MNFGTRDHLDEKNGHLTIGGADVIDLTQEYGTPLYVIDEGRIRSNYRRFAAAFPDADIYYAAKANGNLAVLRVLAQEGAGADVFLSLIHISEPTRQAEISYAVFCLK